MNKLKSSGYRKVLKIAVTMSVFSLPGLSTADEVSSIQVLEEIRENISKTVNDRASYSPKALQKSRQDLEVLSNTSWELTYSLDGVSHVSKIEISDNIRASNDGESEGIIGTFFSDVNGGSGDEVACLFVGDDPEVESLIGIDYLCAASSSPLTSFGFKISGDSMTNGIVGFGNTIEELAISLAMKAPMTGSRIGGPIIEDSIGDSEASYDDATNELIIPVVNYKGAKYRVILQDTGNLVFTLKDAVPAK